jgi:hypothetical protein
MLMKRSMLASALMAAAEVATSTGSASTAAAPAAGAAPTSNDPALATATPAKRAPKNPDNILDIINGRLPLPLVYMIRFDKLGAASNGDNAKKFGTSVGKVFDIKKGRNFGYVDASYLPSAEEVAAAKAWCETGKTAKGKSLKEAGGNPEAILAELAKMTVATAEQVAARNWQIRVVGQPAAAGTAPVGGAAPEAGAAAPAASGATAAAKPAGKLF